MFGWSAGTHPSGTRLKGQHLHAGEEEEDHWHHQGSSIKLCGGVHSDAPSAKVDGLTGWPRPIPGRERHTRPDRTCNHELSLKLFDIVSGDLQIQAFLDRHADQSPKLLISSSHQGRLAIDSAVETVSLQESALGGFGEVVIGTHRTGGQQKCHTYINTTIYIYRRTAVQGRETALRYRGWPQRRPRDRMGKFSIAGLSDSPWRGPARFCCLVLPATRYRGRAPTRRNTDARPAQHESSH